MDDKKRDYDSLLSSIDFFSQNLHLEQIVEYGFNIFNTIEKPSASVIYTYDDAFNQFSAKFQQGYLIPLPVIAKTFKHDDFAVRNGFLLMDRRTQARYFDEAILDNAAVSKILPLIIDDQLYGFIMSTDSVPNGILSSEFLTRFNFLMNLSLEKASRYIERAQLRMEIDRRIFNLNSLSQSMRLLLLELDVEKILQLSIEAIREITTSSVTSISIYDSDENLIKIQSYENLIDHHKYFDTFKLKTLEPIDSQVIFKYSEAQDKLSELFLDASKFEALSAEYVVLLVHHQILGFITIGKPMAQRVYDESLLERIKDIASIMYIGITNANQFELIKAQNEQLGLQLNTMNTTNRIIKNINSAETMSELSDMILTMMQLTFGIESGMLVTFYGEEDQFRGCVGNLEEDNATEIMALIRSQITNEIKVHYTIGEIRAEYGEVLLNLHSGINCFIIAPIFINQFMKEPLGVVVVTQTKQRLYETQVSMIEMLTNSVGPVMGQLLHKELYESNYIPKPEYEIEKIYDKFLLEFNLYSLSFRVYIKKIQKIPFVDTDLSSYEGYNHVLIDQIVVVFSNESIEPALYDEVTEINPDLEEIKSIVTMLAI
ncbi:hypothetical protein [Fusibacter ferrireducens]|uniref:GAF domain-containing protein n=1 Tax=Fusibacter ferrireducens TaxID=2785058 RepID=A0ABR9ZMK2_9FIRM|nr:hypothetical protein [Fusibacter ferrireducens]MBF4691690.1 hypothetical protein [Fusibacter ferrireducens]